MIYKIIYTIKQQKGHSQRSGRRRRRQARIAMNIKIAQTHALKESQTLSPSFILFSFSPC